MFGFDLIGFDAKINKGFFLSKSRKCGVIVLLSLYCTLYFYYMVFKAIGILFRLGKLILHFYSILEFSSLQLLAPSLHSESTAFCTMLELQLHLPRFKFWSWMNNISIVFWMNGQHSLYFFILGIYRIFYAIF